MSAVAVSSREPIRKDSDSASSSKRTVTTMPGPATPAEVGASPTRAVLSRSSSWRIRASFLPCSSRAAWYPPFSFRSPSSRRSLISAAMAGRLAMSSSCSALSRSYDSWVSQVTFAVLSVIGTYCSLPISVEDSCRTTKITLCRSTAHAMRRFDYPPYAQHFGDDGGPADGQVRGHRDVPAARRYGHPDPADLGPVPRPGPQHALRRAVRVVALNGEAHRQPARVGRRPGEHVALDRRVAEVAVAEVRQPDAGGHHQRGEHGEHRAGRHRPGPAAVPSGRPRTTHANLDVLCRWGEQESSHHRG